MEVGGTLGYNISKISYELSDAWQSLDQVWSPFGDRNIKTGWLSRPSGQSFSGCARPGYPCEPEAL